MAVVCSWSNLILIRRVHFFSSSGLATLLRPVQLDALMASLMRARQYTAQPSGTMPRCG
jgi:hypothetical protein